MSLSVTRVMNTGVAAESKYVSHLGEAWLTKAFDPKLR
jgi:hypothetical protein